MAEPWLSEFVPWIAGVESRPSATADGTESLVIAEPGYCQRHDESWVQAIRYRGWY